MERHALRAAAAHLPDVQEEQEWRCLVLREGCLVGGSVLERRESDVCRRPRRLLAGAECGTDDSADGGTYNARPYPLLRYVRCEQEGSAHVLCQGRLVGGAVLK